MRIPTSRFGTIELDEKDLFNFPHGLIGFESYKVWALVPDPDSPAVAWLQSVSRSNQAIAVISPRAFVPEYRACVTRRDLATLKLRPGDRTYIVTTLSGLTGQVSTNLQAPVIINLDRQIGCQVVTTDQQPLRYLLQVPFERRMAA